MARALGAVALATATMAIPSSRAWADGPPPLGATVAIQPRTAGGDYDPALATFAEGAADAFATHGFTILDDTGHATYVAEMVVSRVRVGTGTARVPGQKGVSGNGMGVSIPFSTGRSELVPLQRVTLELRIRRRGETGVIWHGAATTVRAGTTPKGSDRRIAADLLQALLSAYPAEPGATIGVP